MGVSAPDGDLAPIANLRIAGVRITEMDTFSMSHSPWCQKVTRYNYDIEFTTLGELANIERHRVNKYGRFGSVRGGNTPGGQCSLCGGYASEPLTQEQVRLVEAAATFIERERELSPARHKHMADMRTAMERFGQYLQTTKTSA